MPHAILHFGRRSQLIPAGWEEAGAVAFPLVRALVRRPGMAGKLEALRLLAGVSRRQFGKLSAEEVAEFSRATPWLAITPISAPLVTGFRLRGRWYQYPTERFQDGKCLAFALADDFYAEALNPKTDPAEATTAALRLLATIARRPGRPVRSRANAERLAERFRRLPPEHVTHALMYWAGVKIAVDKLYGEWLFQGSPLDRPAPGRRIDFGWWGRLQDVAEAGLFGDLDDVNQYSFHEVCMWMVRKEQDRRSHQLEQENNKPR